ncbi:SusC/RagA family TonB-linked outer membrane protein [Saccharicrinis aurantiacus]|uniref:SusC/RagA family TonB-linked outer membrane protein n=1 Tax=Saccharicrinis aurantiacus TaxID=1849719 RepID=UPI0024912345|nr:SusC/RagA family TonB-linked outer membrane protein [Saccharicrinis aurantiacus]
MRKLALFLFLTLFVGLQTITAQTKAISGKVVDDLGEALPGVAVVIKGTTNGTTTRFDGTYTLQVPTNTTLVFTYIGMAEQEVVVGDQTTINVTLASDSEDLDEVVVTAIGVSRSEKSLGYAATSVSNEELLKAAPVSALAGIQGKVAGVNISTASGAPGASTKVILRGYSSITGSNQPLYVVDGTPVDNRRVGENGSTRSTDFGNNANDINPENIESMTILKGASATALYGSRAANGVVMITTKKGKAGKVKVDYSGAFDWSTPLRLPQLQNEFGQGWNGHWASNENGSWGPKMDGVVRPWGNVVDNSQQTKPFAAQENNMRDFYDIGTSYNNSLSVSGGSENTTFFLSYNNVRQDGIIPTDADSYNRNALSFSGSTKYKKFKASANMNYVRKEAQSVATGQGSSTGATLFQEILQIPRDISIVDMKDYNNKFNNVDNFYTPYAQNPYFVLNENGNNFISDRVYGNVSLDYDFTDELSATARIGTDVTNSYLKDWQAIGRPSEGSPNYSRTPDVGGVLEESRHSREFNTDVLLKYDKQLSDDFRLNGLAGFNVNQNNYRRQTSSIEELTIPGFYDLSNSPNPATTETYYSKKRLFGVYGQVDVSFRNYLFLTAVARNDWSSTLPTDANSFFYPGASLSFILTDAVESLKSDVLSFVKLRTSWGKTGNDADPYQIYNTLVSGSANGGFGQLVFPLGGVAGFEVSNQLGNAALKPELTSEIEFGLDARFFRSRVGVDFAYYSKETDGQILPVDIAATTGYTTQIVNFGVVENKGVELAVNLVPIKTKDFVWDLTWTYANNKNKVLELPDGLDKVTIYDAYGIEFNAYVDEPIGVFRGHSALKDPEGNIVVNPSTGIPLEGEKEVYGNAQSDFQMGLVNNLNYKNWNLGFSFDYRQGGLMYSYTARLNYFVGNATKTSYNDRNPFIVPGSVIQNDDGSYSENTTPVDKQHINEYWNQTNNPSMSREHVVDKTYIKLRDLTLSYRFSNDVLKNTPLSQLTITGYGRNLFLWTPKENNFVDPEGSTYGNDLRSEFGEFAGGPSVRSYGFSLKASF